MVILSKSVKPVATPGEHALIGVELLNFGDGPVDQFLDGQTDCADALLADAQDVALHFVQQRINVPLVIKDPAHHLGASPHHLAEEVFLQDDVQVILKVGGGGDGVGQGGNVTQAADGFDLLLVLEPLLERDEVNGLLGVIHPGQGLKESLVAQIVKGPGAGLELFDALAHAIMGREQNAPQHALFGFDGMRRQAVDFWSGGRGGRFAARLDRLSHRGAGIGLDGINHGLNSKGPGLEIVSGTLLVTVHILFTGRESNGLVTTPEHLL